MGLKWQRAAKNTAKVALIGAAGYVGYSAVNSNYKVDDKVKATHAKVELKHFKQVKNGEIELLDKATRDSSFVSWAKEFSKEVDRYQATDKKSLDQAISNSLDKMSDKYEEPKNDAQTYLKDVTSEMKGLHRFMMPKKSAEFVKSVKDIAAGKVEHKILSMKGNKAKVTGVGNTAMVSFFKDNGRA